MTDARLKLGRAKHHIEDLGGQFQSYFAQQPIKLVTRYEPETGVLAVSVKTAIVPPPQIALTIGDAIHNLRASLDLAYFAILCPLANERDMKNIQFPFHDGTDHGKKSVFGTRKVDLAGKKVRAAIEALETCPNGQYKLYELNEADVRDKHKLLTPIGRAVPISADQFGLIERTLRNRISGPGILYYVGEGEDILRAELPDDDPRHRGGAYEKLAVIQPEFVLHFGEDTAFKTAPLMPTLVTLVGNISHALDRLEEAAA